MKPTLIIVTLVVLSTLNTLAGDVSGKTIKVFTGDNGVKATVLYLEPASDKTLLVKIEGLPDSPINNKVIRVKRSNGGTGEDWKSIDENKIVMSMRKNYGSESYEVYPKPSSDGLPVSFSKEESKTARAADLIEEYQKK